MDENTKVEILEIWEALEALDEDICDLGMVINKIITIECLIGSMDVAGMLMNADDKLTNIDKVLGESTRRLYTLFQYLTEIEED